MEQTTIKPTPHPEQHQAATKAPTRQQNPQTFYEQLRKRPDVAAILERLADK